MGRKGQTCVREHLQENLDISYCFKKKPSATSKDGGNALVTFTLGKDYGMISPQLLIPASSFLLVYAID